MLHPLRSLLLICGLLGGASVPAQTRTVIEGPYVGVLPCADCPGVRVELALERDAATGAARRYWLREVTLDAKAGKRKQEFTAKVTEPKVAEPKVADPNAADTKTEAATPAPAPTQDAKADGTGSIEATVDARSTEAMGAWREEPGSASHGARIVIETINGPRSYIRVSERVLQVVDRGKGTDKGADKGEHRLQLRAGATTPLAAPTGVAVAGLVSRDGHGRLVLAPCADRGAYVLTEDSSAGVRVALDSLDFAHVGRMFLEVYGVPQGSALRVTRLARASADLDCTSAAPAPVTLAVVGADGAWSLRADVDGIRLTLPSATNKPTERGSTAQPLAWSWRDGRAQSASAVLRSGDVNVRLTPRLCRDTMSNTVYGFAADLRWGTQKLSGCAWSAAAEQP